MKFEENLVLEDTENAEELTAEETVEVTEEPVKMYTEEEMNQKIEEEILPKRIGRMEAKLRREYEKKLSPYREAESVLNAGLGTSSITEATDNLRNFYAEKGVSIPEYTEPTYNDEDLKVLAESEAQKIINLGYDDVVEEVDRLADKGENMTPREKLVFSTLANYRKAEGGRQELLAIGVKDDVIGSKEFKEFAGQFNPNTPAKTIYELYTKTQDKPPVEKIGSMKNGATQEEKIYYTPEEVDRLTEKDFDDPVIFKRVYESMSKW